MDLGTLGREEPVRAQVVTMRHVAGMNVEEIAEVLGVTRSTVGLHWTYARAWLHHRLRESTR